MCVSDNPIPSVLPSPDAPDPRLTCWFDGEPATAVAPRHSGGDEDKAAHWIPVCAEHADEWFEDLPEDERLPLFNL